MTSVADRLPELEESVQGAAAAVAADTGASPVLTAVVGEFERKLAKARPAVEGGDPARLRESFVEVEQAGDSAKAAAEADDGAAPETRDAVLAAHQLICVMKAKL
jgi:hypothetical protein